MAIQSKALTKSPNLHLIAGTDGGQVREEALRLFTKLTGGNDDGFTHEMIDGIADNSEGAFQLCARAAEALMTLPMFGGNKVVWLRNVNFLGDDVMGRSQRTEEGVELLRSLLEKTLSPEISFILSTDKIDKRRTFWKFLESHANLRLFDKIDISKEGWQEDVAEIVEKRASALNLRFEEEALELFVMLSGEQTTQIINELEKIDLYLGTERRIVTENDVRTLVPLSRAAIVFETGKAIQTGKIQRAIELIDEQLEADESAIGIMRASIIGVVRNLYLAKLIIEKFQAPTGSYPAFSSALNRLPAAERAWLPQKKDGAGVNLYPVFLAAPYAKNFDLSGLQKALEQTQRADQALVTTGLAHRVILHRLVAEIAAAQIKA